MTARRRPAPPASPSSGGRGGTLGDVLERREGGAPAEDRTLEKAVAGQPVGAVDAGGGHLAAGVEPGDAGGAVDVGANATDHVVGGRGDRDRLPRDVDAVLAARGGDRREAVAHSVAERPAVEQHVVGAVVDEALPDGARHDVASGQLAARIGVEQEPAPALVDDVGSLAAHRLADEESRRTRHGQGGGVELHELHARHLGADLPRQRDAVAGRLRRVGGVAPDLPAPPLARMTAPAPTTCIGPKAPRPRKPTPAQRPSPSRSSVTTGASSITVTPASRSPRHECRLDLAPGGIPAGVHDAVAAVRRLPADA